MSLVDITSGITHLLPIHPRAHEHDMHRPAPTLLLIPAPAMVHAPQHHERFAGLHLHVHDALVPVGPEIRLLVPLEVRAGHHPRGADLARRVAPGDEQHVAAGFVVVGLGGGVPRVMVLVVAVEALRGGSRADSHRDGRWRGAGAWCWWRGGVVVVGGREGEEVFGEVLVRYSCVSV